MLAQSIRASVLSALPRIIYTEAFPSYTYYSVETPFRFLLQYLLYTYIYKRRWLARISNIFSLQFSFSLSRKKNKASFSPIGFI